MDHPPQVPGPPFRTPLGVFQSLGAAFKVYFSNFNTLVIIMAIFVVPATIITVLAVRLAIGDDLLSFDPSTQENPFEGMERSEVISIAAAFFVGITLNLIISMIATGACFQAIHEALLGNRPDWKTSIRATLDRLGALIWLAILLGLLFLGAVAVGVLGIGLLEEVVEGLGALGGLALIFGVIYAFVSWSVAIPALMAEDVRGMEALKRSRHLVKGEWWPVLGTYVLMILIIAIVGSILSAIFNPAGRTGDEGLVLSTLSSVVSNVIFTPFQAALVGVVYFNLVLKKAAAQTAGDIPIPPPPPPATPPPPGP